MAPWHFLHAEVLYYLLEAFQLDLISPRHDLTQIAEIDEPLKVREGPLESKGSCLVDGRAIFLNLFTAIPAGRKY